MQYKILATVDDAEYSPEQKRDEKSDGALALSGSDALDEDQVETERRQDDHRVEYLQTVAFIYLVLPYTEQLARSSCNSPTISRNIYALGSTLKVICLPVTNRICDAIRQVGKLDVKPQLGPGCKTFGGKRPENGVCNGVTDAE